MIDHVYLSSFNLGNVFSSFKLLYSMRNEKNSVKESYILDDFLDKLRIDFRNSIWKIRLEFTKENLFKDYSKTKSRDSCFQENLPESSI